MGKKHFAYSDLVAVNVIALFIIIAVVPLHSGPMRMALGLPLVFFLPGYALVAAMFPRRGEPGGIARIALGFGLSFAIAALDGLILNYTPWGITIYPLLVSLCAFVVVTSAFAWFRRLKLPAEQRFGISIPAWGVRYRQISGKGWIALTVLAVAVMVAIGAVAYNFVSPGAGEGYTEFYILGEQGNVGDYPTRVTVGTSVSVTLGVVNHQGTVTSYHVVVSVDGEESGAVGPIILGHQEKWEGEVSFVPKHVGQSRRVDFLLYREGESEPLADLHIIIDVIE